MEIQHAADRQKSLVTVVIGGGSDQLIWSYCNIFMYSQFTHAHAYIQLHVCARKHSIVFCLLNES